MSALVELRSVDRVYASGPTAVAALRGVDLELEQGDYLAVTGPSGAGKSTLLSILGLLDRPSGGVRRFDGVDIGSLTERDRARLRGSAIGFVFQSFHLLPGRTVSENVAMAFAYSDTPVSVRRDLVAEAIERVGLAHRARFLPALLSGGERQRVAIARAVCARPRLLLADEPTGNLDPHTTQSILDLFDDLSTEGLTIVTITHDRVVAERARRRATLRAGRLEQVCRASEVLS